MDIIFTNHAKERLDNRKITKDQIYKTISSPDSKVVNSDNSMELAREFGSQKVHVVLKENENGEKIILSCWINPPNQGSVDHNKKEHNKKMKQSSGLKKLWHTLINQISN